MIGVRCFSDTLGRTQLTLSGWVEFGPTKICEVIFWQILIVGVTCTSFFSFSFLAGAVGSCNDSSYLGKFLCFFQK